MIRHDFLCSKCGMKFEVVFPSAADFRREWPCYNCAGVAKQIWLQAPGLAGVSEPSTRGVTRSFQPGYDRQAGRHFETRSERDRWAKSQGLEIMGPQEFARSAASAKEPEPKIDDAKLNEAMEYGYQRALAGDKPEFATLEQKPVLAGDPE